MTSWLWTYILCREKDARGKLALAVSTRNTITSPRYSLFPRAKMHDLVPLPSPGALISYEQAEAELVARYQAAEKAASTRRAYRSDARAFTRFCRARGLCELPATPDTVCLFLSWSADAGLSPSSIGRRIAAISYAHELAGLESPTGAKASRSPSPGSGTRSALRRRRKPPRRTI